MREFFRRSVQRVRVWSYTLPPSHALMIGYTFYILAAFGLLCLPICRKAEHVPLIDTLFTAVSSVSTAGLQAVDFSETYNVLGQIVILLGIQIGGLGFMTLGSLVILASKGHLPRNRIKIGKAVLTMPEAFEPTRFLKHIAVFTFSIELIGTLILWYFFSSTGTPNPLWAAIFHSVTAFCTAGVSIFSNNLESYSDHAGITLTIALLSLLGGIGFIVLDDLYRSIKSKSLRTTLTTRIILTATFGAVIVGTVFLFFDPGIAEFSLKKRFLTAFFQTVTALTTAGFNSVPMSHLSSASLVIVIMLMVLGASPSGTGGGLKSTTWSAAIASIVSFCRGSEEVTFFHCKVPHGRIIAAFASITLYVITFVIGTYCMLCLETLSFEQIVFEVAAALGTAGMSHGITSQLSVGGKMVIMVLMYIGRLGLLVLALGAVALYQDFSYDKGDSDAEPPPAFEEEDIVL